MNIDKLSGIASILGLFFTIGGYFTANNPIHIWLLSLTALIFIFLCCYSFKRYNMVLRYLNGEADIRNLHNKLILEYPNVKTKSLDAIILCLSNYCTQIAEAYEKIKNEKIGVCIKYTNGEISNPYVKTLCRDIHSLNSRQEVDESKRVDYMFQNTDFAHILQLVSENKKYKDLFYCGNRLANKHQYANTHLMDIELPSGLFSYYQRRNLWPLPYKSSIVVPFLSADGRNIDAFLCIDCPLSNGFNIDRDVVILQQIALFMRELICFVCTTHLINRQNG